MKLTKLMSFLLMAVLMMAMSCKKEDEPPSSLSVSPTSIASSAMKSNYNIDVTSNTSWIITDVPSWIEVFPASGKSNGSIQVTVNENTSTEERSAYIVIATEDGNIKENVKVNQAAKEVILSVDVTSISLSSAANSSQAINITCNGVWSIGGVPDWLQISSLSGNGNSSTVVTTRSANESATIRSATIVISSDGQTQSITVQQEAALSSCAAIPSNVTSLYYAVVFSLQPSSEVALTKMLLLSDYDFKHKTEAEIISDVEKESSQIPEDETIYTRGVDEQKKYHILTISYDKKGNRGELIDVEFESPKYLSATDDAWCAFEDATYNNSLFWFTVKKKGRCASYDLIYGANIAPSYLRGPLMAYEINYFIKNGRKNWLAEGWELQIETNYPNDNTFSCAYSNLYQYGGLIATTWGVFNDGTRSSDINTISVDTYAEEAQSFNGNKKSISSVEWIRNQKGWIKFSSKDLKNKR